ARMGMDPETGLDPLAGIQRTLLLQTALANLDRLQAIPLHPSVSAMIYDEFQFFARPSSRELRLFQPDSYTFEALAKIALLERFPAGQFHWEVSGLPRSWLLKVPASVLPRLMSFIAQAKGFAPFVFPHLATRRKNPLVLPEKECDRSWYRIARSVELQSNVKGLVASSWLHSTDTFKISPHLSFMNKPFLESGGIVTTMGKADEMAGYLRGSATRRKLYESGEFKPTLGLILWSREQMIRWARSHPELDGDPGYSA
ncbi:MAG: hypothetical protein JO033_10175, partial [Acidobacteriaceae bacterium]|nr:hypothetical protein [Acidobacteriaceae bacterium]